MADIINFKKENNKSIKFDNVVFIVSEKYDICSFIIFKDGIKSEYVVKKELIIKLKDDLINIFNDNNNEGA